MLSWPGPSYRFASHSANYLNHSFYGICEEIRKRDTDNVLDLAGLTALDTYYRRRRRFKQSKYAEISHALTEVTGVLLHLLWHCRPHAHHRLTSPRYKSQSEVTTEGECTIHV